MSVKIISDTEFKTQQQKKLAELRRGSCVANEIGSFKQVLFITDVINNGEYFLAIDLSDHETMQKILAIEPKKIWIPDRHDCVNIISSENATTTEAWERRRMELYDYLNLHRREMILDPMRNNNCNVTIFFDSDDTIKHVYHRENEKFSKNTQSIEICLVFGNMNLQEALEFQKDT